MIYEDGTIIPHATAGTMLSVGPGGFMLILRRERLKITADDNVVSVQEPIDAFMLPHSLARGLLDALAQQLGLEVTQKATN